jgi:sulfate adenylyltransferase large subunit
LLRLVTAGSVDDGKSTLLGRLLYDSHSVYEDQIRAVERASREGLDLALLTDGLRAEREQGITIDVAYRYFSTAKRKFILSDAPGHEQYTRNMATGASNADLAILLVDASRGIQPQSKRHAYIIGLLGIRHLVIVLNKMDLVGYSKEIFYRLRSDLLAAIEQLSFDSVEFFPLSAATGENVVHPSSLMKWFEGPTLLAYLETVNIGANKPNSSFRLPVQRVERIYGFRAYSGQIAGGSIQIGDSVTVLPSLRSTRIKSILTFDGELRHAIAPQSVALTLEDELDISRGDVIAASENVPVSARKFQAHLIWFSEDALDPRRYYLLKHSAQIVASKIVVENRLNISTLHFESAGLLHINDIGSVRVETSKPIFFDQYQLNRATGGFILIDPVSNNTVAGGMIAVAVPEDIPMREAIRAGVIVDLTGRESFADSLETYFAQRQSSAVVLYRWNHEAAKLLSDGGFHVFVLDVPPEVKDIIRLDSKRGGEAAFEDFMKLLDNPDSPV